MSEDSKWAQAIRAELVEQLGDIALAGSYSLRVSLDGPHLQTFVPESSDKIYVRCTDGQWRAVERAPDKMFDWRTNAKMGSMFFAEQDQEVGLPLDDADLLSDYCVMQK